MTAPAVETIRAGNSYRYIRRSFTPKGAPRKPLPFFTQGETVSPNCTAGDGGQAIGVISGTWDQYKAKAYAAAYDKFVSAAKEDLSTQMAVNLAERHEAAAMLAKRVGQVLDSARAIARWARGDFRKPPKGVRRRKQPLPKTVSAKEAVVGKAKTLSDLWLEYHFGWEPLLKDIHDTVQILQQSGGLPERSLITRGRSQYVYHDYYAPPGYYPLWRDDVCDYYVALRGKVRITNPNLFQANRLGLINPASVLWERIPFSFVADWFVPVGRFLDQYTDQVGWSTSELQCSTSARCTYSYVMGGPYGVTYSAAGYQVERTVGIPLSLPKFSDRSGTGIKSVVRGATAVALLVGFLKHN